MHHVRLPVAETPRRHRDLRPLAAAALACFAGSAAAYDWPQFNGDPQHSGNNTAETAITAANVNTLVSRWQFALPPTTATGTGTSVSDGVPVFADGITTANGVKDLAFISTKTGGIVAVDANTGTQLWVAYFPDPTQGSSCTNGECSNSSPVIDPNRKYVYHYGVDGKIHKLNIATGAELTDANWPQVSTLKPQIEKSSSALAMAVVYGTPFLFSAISAHNGDGGDNQGHLTTINLFSGTQSVFNMVCSNQNVHFTTGGSPDCGNVLAGGWARPGAVYDAGTNRVFVGTGNGHYNPGSFLWGDSIVALQPYGKGADNVPVDAYTPTNFQDLDNGDTDLGSTAPAILPVPASSKVQHLAAQSGKDAKIRLINLADLSGAGGPGHTGGEVASIINVPQGGAVRTQPAVWVNPADNSTWLFVVNTSGASGLKLVFDGSGNPSLSPIWHDGVSGASPHVANGVLYYASNNNFYARNPTTGTTLWSSTAIGGIHWQSPVVNCGSAYVIDGSSKLNAFGLNLNRPSVSGGNDQAALAGATFGSALSVRVADHTNAPLNNVQVTFSLPSSGPSATFGSALTATAMTNASGIATVAAPVANNSHGDYVASATIANGACAAQFHLHNDPMSFAAVTAGRLLDTRAESTTVDGTFAAIGSFASAGKVDLNIANRGGVPASSIGAVVLSVSAVESESTGFVTFWPTGATQPLAGNLNPTPGLTITNQVVAKVGTNSQVSIYNGGSASTGLVVNVQGWLPTTSGYNPIVPARFLDTRQGAQTIDGQGNPGAPLATQGSMNLVIAGRDSIPANAAAAIIKVTGILPPNDGFITLWPTGTTQPATGNLNLNHGITVSGLTVVPLGTSGQVSLFNGSPAAVDLTADVQGWFASGSAFNGIAPARLIDTRNSTPIAPGGTLDITVAGQGGIPATPGSTVLKLTAVLPTAAGFLTMWPTGDTQPQTGNLNLNPNHSLSNIVFVKTGTGGKVSVYNGSTAPVNIVIDAQGWFAGN